MSDLSPVLALPYILAAQAQKHVTHNEALRMLDVLVQTVVLNRDLTVPPASPVEGDCHIVAPGATGSWAGQDDRIAVFVTDHWEFHTPQPGWTAYVLAENSQATHSGSGWAVSGELPLLVARLGVSSSPDATNRLSVSSPATLLNHAGAGHQVKINKAASGDTASLLYQTGFSGRAEMGTTGSDDFEIKVSADGSSFSTGLTIAAATAKVSLPAGALVADGTATAPGLAFGSDSDTGLCRAGTNQIGFVTGGVKRADLSTTTMLIDLPVTGTAVTQSNIDTTAGRLLKVGDAGLLIGDASGINITNMDTHSISASRWESGTTGSPATIGMFLHLARATGSAVQLAIDVNGQLYVRRRGSGTWGGWRFYFDRSSILGTVSQSAGVPTGALIETGSNANGRYERRANGALECWQTMAASSGAAATWTFPSAFNEAPRVTGNAEATVLSCVCLDTAPGTTSVTFSARDKTDARRADTVHLHAIGRWSSMT